MYTQIQLHQNLYGERSCRLNHVVETRNCVYLQVCNGNAFQEKQRIRNKSEKKKKNTFFHFQ